MDIFCEVWYSTKNGGRPALRGRCQTEGRPEMKAFHEVRSYNSDFMVWQSAYKNISFLAHWHQELELIYVRAGQAHLCINDDEFTAHAGDLIFVDTGDFHYSDSTAHENELDFIVFDPGIVSQHYHRAHFASPLITADELASYGLSGHVLRLFHCVHDELRSRDSGYQEIVSAMLTEFLFRLRRSHARLDETLTSRSHRAELLYDMQQLLTWIDDHYGEDITLSYAAGRMNFSESHFSKIFKKLIGINFVTYINAVRIEHAAEMLRSSGEKITDIAIRCGFGNIRSFNRTFKEYTGCTPSQFLKLPDAQVQNFSFYKRKTSQTEYVENDSLTVIPNTLPKETSKD